MPVPSDQSPWRRQLDDPRLPIIPHPVARFYPGTLADLVEIVKQAEASPTPIPAVRAVGSHWAPCEAAVNREGYIVESHDPQELRDPDPTPAPPRGRFSRPLFDVIGTNGCLTDDALRFFREQGVAPFQADDASDLSDAPDTGPRKFFLAHFEAGARIYEVYDHLDLRFDQPESLSSAPGFENYRGPWAVPTLGGAGGQTLAGAISTGTHGGDIFMPPIADAVQALHIVGAGGKQYWFDRDLPGGIRLTSNSKLLARYGPTLEIRHDDESLDAAMVSVGRFGIIYSVVLRIVRQFALEQVTNPDPATRAPGEDPLTWPVVKERIKNIPDSFGGERFLQVIINPNGRSGADEREVHSCYITVRKTRPLAAAIPAGQAEPNGRAERTGVNAGTSDSYGSDTFGNLICRHASSEQLEEWFDPLAQVVHHVLEDTRLAFLAVVAVAIQRIGPPPLSLVLAAALAIAAVDDDALETLMEFARDNDVAKDEADAVAGALRAVDIFDDVITHRDGRTIGGMVAEMCNRFVEADRVEYARFLGEMLITSAGRPKEMTAISYAVMDSHSYADTGCTNRGVSLEAFADASTDKISTLVESIFTALSQLQSGTLPRAGGRRLAYAGVIALRFTKASRALIAMQQDEITCSLELQGLGGCNGNQVFMEEITDVATRAGIRMHWGQFNETVGVDSIEAQYQGKLERWRDVLASLTHNGRQTTFSTPFTFRKGLEVVRPAIASFSVIPWFAAAGEPGIAAWDATDNPADTKVRVTVTPVGGAGTTDELDLRDVKHFQFISGETDIALVAGRSAYGREYTATESIRVRGFGPANPEWHNQKLAVPTVVSGAMRFAVPIVFLPERWSKRLRAETITVDSDPTDPGARWILLGPGAIRREFASGIATQVFLHRPHLNGPSGGEWLFVYHGDRHDPSVGPAPMLRVRFRLGSDPIA